MSGTGFQEDGGLVDAAGRVFIHERNLLGIVELRAALAASAAIAMDLCGCHDAFCADAFWLDADDEAEFRGDEAGQERLATRRNTFEQWRAGDGEGLLLINGELDPD